MLPVLPGLFCVLCSDLQLVVFWPGAESDGILAHLTLQNISVIFRFLLASKLNFTLLDLLFTFGLVRSVGGHRDIIFWAFFCLKMTSTLLTFYPPCPIAAALHLLDDDTSSCVDVGDATEDSDEDEDTESSIS